MHFIAGIFFQADFKASNQKFSDSKTLKGGGWIIKIWVGTKGIKRGGLT